MRAFTMSSRVLRLTGTAASSLLKNTSGRRLEFPGNAAYTRSKTNRLQPTGNVVFSLHKTNALRPTGNTGISHLKIGSDQLATPTSRRPLPSVIPRLNTPEITLLDDFTTAHRGMTCLEM